MGHSWQKLNANEEMAVMMNKTQSGQSGLKSRLVVRDDPCRNLTPALASVEGGRYVPVGGGVPGGYMNKTWLRASAPSHQLPRKMQA